MIEVSTTFVHASVLVLFVALALILSETMRRVHEWRMACLQQALEYQSLAYEASARLYQDDATPRTIVDFATSVVQKIGDRTFADSLIVARRKRATTIDLPTGQLAQSVEHLVKIGRLDLFENFITCLIATKGATLLRWPHSTLEGMTDLTRELKPHVIPQPTCNGNTERHVQRAVQEASDLLIAA